MKEPVITKQHLESIRNVQRYNKKPLIFPCPARIANRLKELGHWHDSWMIIESYEGENDAT